MALPVRELTALIAHKIDTSEQGAMSAIAIVNEAGRFLVSLRPWTFQLRPSTTAGILNGQSYFALKPDFGRLAGPPVSHPSAQRVRVIELRSFDIVNRLRGQPNPSSGIDGVYAGALVHSPLTSPGGPPLPRIELWPTPSVTDANAFSISYFANWNDVNDDDDLIDLPAYAEGLFRHIVRETAAGYEHDDEKSVWDRMDDILASKIYEAAVIADGGMQQNLGPLEGGAADLVAMRRASGWGNRHFYPVHI